MIPFRCQCSKTYQFREQNTERQVRYKCGRKSIVPGVEVTQSQLPTQLQQTPDANVGVTIEATVPKSSGEKDRNYGNHRLVRLFARGGMGQVNIARDESLKREVALKELFENAVDRKNVIQRFCDEVEITARLEHPGNGTLTVTNSTITRNTANDGGGILTNGNLKIYNTIVVENSHSDITQEKGTIEGNNNLISNAGATNVPYDPDKSLFVNATGDFRLGLVRKRLTREITKPPMTQGWIKTHATWRVTHDLSAIASISVPTNIRERKTHHD